MRQIAVILNPKAGRGMGAKRRPELERRLQEAVSNCPEPFEWKIIETEAKGQGMVLARESVKNGADIVAAAGGDGTLNEVVNGLVGTTATLGLLPLGTGNDFARCLGIGTDLQKGIETLLYGTARTIDLGQAHGRWFLNIAGCGFDAKVAERVNRGFPFLRGPGAYLAAIALSLLHLKPATLTLTLDGETQTVRALMCSVANATSYGGGMMVTPDAKIDDGLFDICLLREAGPMEFLLAFPQVFKGAHTTHRRVTMHRARTVKIESDILLSLLIDGEIIGTTPVEFTLVPHAIRVMSV